MKTMWYVGTNKVIETCLGEHDIMAISLKPTKEEALQAFADNIQKEIAELEEQIEELKNKKCIIVPLKYAEKKEIQ